MAGTVQRINIRFPARAFLTKLLLVSACGGGAEAVLTPDDPVDEPEGRDPPPDSSCPPGTAGKDCTPCDAGSFCAGGTAPAVGCADGTHDHDGDPKTACVAWSECEPGSFVQRAGSRTEDRACSPCDPGTFSTGANAMTCEAWTSCPAGTYVSVQGTTVANQVCSSCPSGSFTGSADQSECIAWSDCDPGMQVATMPSASADRTCER